MVVTLGTKVKDSVTGYQGIAIGRATWLYGDRQIAVQAPVGADGKVPDVYWVDESRLEEAAQS